MKDIAEGILLGVLIGDASGAPLEFLGRKPDEAEVDRALEFPGGGAWSVAPGQITDDGELTLSLARGLIAGGLPQIAQAYAAWLRSRPFDVGNTTARAFRVPPSDTLVQSMRQASQGSLSSKANGSLMRCAPLAVWGHRLSRSQLALVARSDSALSHPNPVCQDAVASYVLALRHLLLNPGDGAGAFEVAKSWVQDEACEEVQAWLQMAEAGERPAFYPLAGFVKIGFVHALVQLRAGADYRQALFETLLGGGDTDTNAAIVGGMVGARVGRAGVPQVMVERLMACETEAGRPRPEVYHPRQVPLLVERLLEVAPAEVDVEAWSGSAR